MILSVNNNDYCLDKYYLKISPLLSINCKSYLSFLTLEKVVSAGVVESNNSQHFSEEG